MLICYLDESGNTGRKLDDPAQPFHTIAAVLVREDRVREMTDRLDELASRAPTETELVEYHGSELFHGIRAWDGVYPRQRIAEYSTALSVLRQIEAGVVHSAIDKPRLAAAFSFPRPPHMYALQFLAEKLEWWLRDQTHRLSQRALLVADENHEAEQYSFDLISDMQAAGGPIGSSLGINTQLGHIVDGIYFAPSERSRGIQLADLVAFILNRRYRNRRTPGNPRSDNAVSKLVRDHIIPQRRTYRSLWPL